MNLPARSGGRVGSSVESGCASKATDACNQERWQQPSEDDLDPPKDLPKVRGWKGPNHSAHFDWPPTEAMNVYSVILADLRDKTATSRCSGCNRKNGRSVYSHNKTR